jgi:hypothetical protein
MGQQRLAMPGLRLRARAELLKPLTDDDPMPPVPASSSCRRAAWRVTLPPFHRDEGASESRSPGRQPPVEAVRWS